MTKYKLYLELNCYIKVALVNKRSNETEINVKKIYFSIAKISINALLNLKNFRENEITNSRDVR